MATINIANHKTSSAKPEKDKNPTTKNNTGGKSDINSILEVRYSPLAFASGAYSLINANAGSQFTRITGTSPATKTYTSVQIGPRDHIELNSDLVYCNHSCAPSLEFDMKKFEIRVVKGKDLKIGDPLTFFYPSTEWDMAQPFDCNCGAKECHHWIDGAKNMDRDILGKYWLNEHIASLLAEENGTQNNFHEAENGTQRDQLRGNNL